MSGRTQRTGFLPVSDRFSLIVWDHLQGLRLSGWSFHVVTLCGEARQIDFCLVSEFEGFSLDSMREQDTNSDRFD